MRLQGKGWSVSKKKLMFTQKDLSSQVPQDMKYGFIIISHFYNKDAQRKFNKDILQSIAQIKYLTKHKEPIARAI